jgi:ABC-2 type transport system permease protein
MRHFLTILSHEIRSLLFSASTYIAAVLFLLVHGVRFAGLLEEYTKTPQETAASRWCSSRPFWLPVWFMVPAAHR